MAGKILKAGIRFNDADLKYISFTFTQDRARCDVTAVLMMNGTEMTVRGKITAWDPVEDKNESDSTLQETRAAKTTAKKTVKESK